MNGIAMTETDGIEHLAIIVECCRSPDDFVLAITIDIAYRQVVITVSIHGVASKT